MRQWITGVILGTATLGGIYLVSLDKKDCTPCAQSVIPTPEVQVVKPKPTCPTCNVVDVVDLNRIRPEPDYRPTVSFDEPPLANPNGIVRTNFAVPSTREEAPAPKPVLEELPMPMKLSIDDEDDNPCAPSYRHDTR